MTRLCLVGGAAMLLAITNTDFAKEDKEHLSPWQVRVRALAILPDEEASIRPVAGSVDVDEAVTPELDISYFFTDHIAAELVLLISNHDVSAKLAGVGNVDLGEVNLLPPTLLLQYHFRPEAKFRPYAGAGVNALESFGPVHRWGPWTAARAAWWVHGTVARRASAGFG